MRRNHMDLNEALDRADRAARRGDITTLEVELGRLRALPEDSVVGIDTFLRSVARSVRCHPAFCEMPEAKAV
jgi:hypothetical protein